MADVKISQLPAATTPLDGTEVLPIVQSATTKQVSIANVTAGRAMAASSLTLTTPLAVTSGGTGIATAAQGSLLSATAADTFSATRTPTLGLAGTAAGTLGLSGSTSGVVTLATAATAGTWTLTLPTTGGTNGYILTTNGAGVSSWTNPTALGIDLDVGGTAITGGVSGRVLYDNAGVLGEYTVTGTAGNVVLSTSPTLATPTFTTSFTSPLHIGGTTASSSLTLQSTSGVGTSDSILLKVGNNGATTAATVDTLGNVTLGTATLAPTQTVGGSMAMTGTVAMGSSFKRNRIINGDMKVAQRNTTYNPSGYYQYGSVDRWSSTSNASNTIAQSTDAPTGFKNSCSISATSAAYPGIAQRIESVNCTDLVGQTITISAYVKKTTGTTTVDVALYYANSADNFGGITLIGAQTSLAPSPTSTWTRYSIQFTNLPAGAANGLQLSIFTSSGSTSDVWLITGVQLEVGSVATPYERQIYTDQLAQCYRYYQQYSGNQKMIGHGYVFNATNMYRWGFPLGIEMRAAPTLAFSGDVRVWGGSGPNVASATSTVGTSYTQTNFVDADIVCAGVTTTVGLVGKLILNTSTAYISLSSEL